MTDPKRKQAILEETPTEITHGKQWNCWTGRKQLTASGCLLSNTSSNASIERLKVRLMGKGYTQTCGLDFQKTFVLVTKMNTIRVLPSLVAKLDRSLQQFDVKNAFFHGNLEEVYIDLTPSFEENKEERFAN